MGRAIYKVSKSSDSSQVVKSDEERGEKDVRHEKYGRRASSTGGGVLLKASVVHYPRW